MHWEKVKPTLVNILLRVATYLKGLNVAQMTGQSSIIPEVGSSNLDVDNFYEHTLIQCYLLTYIVCKMNTKIKDFTNPDHQCDQMAK